jgi:hypothetical protein
LQDRVDSDLSELFVFFRYTAQRALSQSTLSRD